jgi:hypothetical protein
MIHWGSYSIVLLIIPMHRGYSFPELRYYCRFGIGSNLKIIEISDQSFLYADNRRYPPHTLPQENVLITSGVRYYLLESVYNNVVFVLKGKGHS